MFRLSSPHKADMATDMAIPLIAESGWSAMTLRALGRAAKISGPAVAAWYGSVERLHEVIAARYGHRWLQLVFLRLPGYHNDVGVGEILATLLPADEDEVALTRVWLAIQEAGRTEPRVGAVVAAIESQEEDLLARRLETRSDEAMIVLRGLRAAMCAPGTPLAFDDARRMARRLGDALAAA